MTATERDTADSRETPLDIVVVATESATGTVLRAGKSRVLRLGAVIPWAASRWVFGGEEWDFIIPPPEMRIVLRNVIGSTSRPSRLSRT